MDSTDPLISSIDLPPPDTTPGHQTWTQSGHPIVDGKYQDKAGTVRRVPADEWLVAGPPALDVFWVNRKAASDDDQDSDARFQAIASHAFISVTEYISRIGEFLRVANGSCQIMSLNATLYSVNVIVATDMPCSEMVTLLFKQRLAPAH